MSAFDFFSELEEIDHIGLCRDISIKAHRGQKRRGTDEPYSSHPLKVSKMVDTAYLKCIAYLHDVLEDTEETIYSLREKGVDQSVIDGVDILTHKKGESYELYIKRIAQHSQLAKIKIADMMDNLCGQPSERQKEKYHKSLIILLGAI